MPAPVRPFTVDDDYDRTYADATRTSRYGNYLASREHLFRDEDTDAPTTDWTRFAALAMDIAQSPIMSPGYVHTHPRIQSVSTGWGDEQNGFAVTVRIAAPLPAQVAAVTAGQSWQDWDRDRYSGWWYEPEDDTRPAAYTLVTIRIPVPYGCLPAPGYVGTAPDVQVAKDTVRLLCQHLNQHLQPIFTALDNPPR